MGKKPTYEELEQKAKALEEEPRKRERAEDELKQKDKTVHALLNAPPDWVVLIDPEGTIIAANEVAAQRLGARKNNLVGSCVYDYFPPEIAEFRKARRDEVLRSKKLLQFEDERNGMIFTTCLYPILDEHGEVHQIAIVARDITEQKQAAEALSASETQKKAILDSSVDRIRLVDKDMRIIWANLPTAKAFKTTPEALVGQTCYGAFLGRNKACPGCPAKKASKTGHIEHGIIHRDHPRVAKGESHWDIHAVPIKDKSGKVVNLVQITRNITKQKKAEKALREREKELKIKKNSLEEVNTALRVLLRSRDDDRKEMEEKILVNVKELVHPYLEKLKKTKLDHPQQGFLSVLEANLENIVAPFTRTLSSKYLSLTPTEIKVANLVREGKSTIEAAEIMNLSRRTIESHRDSVRKKLGIKHRKANLRSHLLSI